MRKQFIRTIENIMGQDPRLVLLLGDIGVFGFRNVFESNPSRTFNIGICEQAMTGIAAGLAKEALIPVLHSIAPFLVERCFEQLKVDLCYQRLSAKIITVGASYDYAALGCTHHCPGDIALLQTLPGMEIIVPGTPEEFDVLFRATYANRRSSYFRLSEKSHAECVGVEFGRANVIRRGGLGTLIVIGPLLSTVLEATTGLDISILYYTTLAPFDSQTLLASFATEAVAIVEPFYEGTTAHEVLSSINERSVRLLSIGVPRRFLTNYGKAAEHDYDCSLTAAQIQPRLKRFFREPS